MKVLIARPGDPSLWLCPRLLRSSAFTLQSWSQWPVAAAPGTSRSPPLLGYSALPLPLTSSSSSRHCPPPRAAGSSFPAYHAASCRPPDCASSCHRPDFPGSPRDRCLAAAHRYSARVSALPSACLGTPHSFDLVGSGGMVASCSFSCRLTTEKLSIFI